MRGFRVALWILTAVLILAVPAALAQQTQKPHRHNGDIWVGCVKNAPPTTVEQALNDVVSIANRENRSCWVSQRQGWLFLHRTKHLIGIIIRKTAVAKGTDYVGP